MDNKKLSFEPIFSSNSKILIFGSFPSVKSREKNFYYSHKQNRFWNILPKIFGESSPETIEEKINFVKRNNLALWDIIDSCCVVGSLDTNIKDIEVVDLNIILKNSNIEKILCNGRLAYNLTMKYYPLLKDIIFYLPSTSPANTNFDFNIWENFLMQKK